MELLSVDEILLICEHLNVDDLTSLCNSSHLICATVLQHLLQMLKNLCLLIDDVDFTISAQKTWNCSNLWNRIRSNQKIRSLFYFSNHIKNALKFLGSNKPSTDSLFSLIYHTISSDLFLIEHFYYSWFDACKFLIKNLNLDYFNKMWQDNGNQISLGGLVLISRTNQITSVFRIFSSCQYIHQTFESIDESIKRITLLLKHIPSSINKHSKQIRDIVDLTLVCSSSEYPNRIPLYLKNSQNFGHMKILYINSCVKYKVNHPPIYHCKIKGMTAFETKLFLIGTMGMSDDKLCEINRTVVPIWKKFNRTLKNKGMRKSIYDAYQVFEICHLLTPQQIYQRTLFVLPTLKKNVNLFFDKWARNLLVEPSSDIVYNELLLGIPYRFLYAAKFLCGKNNIHHFTPIYRMALDFQLFQIDYSVLKESNFNKCNYTFNDLYQLRNNFCDLSHL